MENKKNYIAIRENLNITAIMTALLLGGFIALLNETILNVAFPDLMTEFNISAGTVQWLATGYMLVIGILVPITAFLMNTFTTKQLYLTAMFLFVIGTLVAAFSTSFSLLLFARIIQGCGTGMLVPIMMNTVVAINPPEKRGTAMGSCLLVILLAPAVGPTISGILLQFLNWSWLFLIMLPFAFIAIFFGAVSLENFSELTKPKIDIISIVLSTLGFGGIIYAISNAENMGFFNITVVVPFIIGFVSLILFTKRQFSLDQPILNLRIFKYSTFSIGITLIIFAMMTQFSINIILPTLIQNGLNLSSSIAGLILLPGGLIGGLTPPVAGRIYDRFGPRVLVPSGFACMIIGIGLLAQASITTSLLAIVVFYCLSSLGAVIIISSCQANSLNTLPRTDTAHGIAIINTLMQIAAALGSTLFVGLMASKQKDYINGAFESNDALPQLSLFAGVNQSLFIATILLIFGLLVSLFLKRAKVIHH